MYKAELSTRFLSQDETEIFNEFLSSNKLDFSIWTVFAKMFESGTKHSIPLMLRIYLDDELHGACIIIKCRKYGRALFHNRILAGMIDLYRIPCHLWIRFGCCMDMMSNPGFIRDASKQEEVIRAMTHFLSRNTIVTMVTDYPENMDYYVNASILPALPHALINTAGMISAEDYTSKFKNIKRKTKVFSKKGGEYIRIERNLNSVQLSSLKSCFQATAEKSIFYLPYQDLYLNSALNTSKIPIDNVYYFVAMLDGNFLGYQAAIKTGKYLNALHGAFNRNLTTTYHAYDILFVKMTEFAIENGLEWIDFGAVLNSTKQRMVDTTMDLSYYLLSKFWLIQYIFKLLLRFTRIQGTDQMKFRN